jgi:hypothetical protein
MAPEEVLFDDGTNSLTLSIGWQANFVLSTRNLPRGWHREEGFDERRD